MEATRSARRMAVRASLGLLPGIMALVLGGAVLPADVLFAKPSHELNEQEDDGHEMEAEVGHHGGHRHSHHHAGRILHPGDARELGLDSLRRAIHADGGVPLPPNLEEYVVDRQAAVQLGKALFWDMQVGSDGVQACASCHFHAGADDRSKNTLNPREGLLDEQQGPIKGYFFAGANLDRHFETKQPNGTLTREDFPLVKNIQDLTRTADGNVLPGYGNSNDIVGSMGTFFTRFDGVLPGKRVDVGTPQLDPVFNLGGQLSVRQVGHFNAPTVINAVFNFTNNWNGTASSHFNGRDVFGDGNPGAVIFINQPGMGLVPEHISLANASLSSQAMNPPNSPREMAFGDPSIGNARRFSQIGIKVLRPSAETGAPLTPLGLQQVHPQDSVLGSLVQGRLRGLATTYDAMIKKAFVGKYWNSPITIPTPIGELSHMEANFGFYFGLAVGLYETTLVADETSFDRWMETGSFHEGFGKSELAGLNLFAGEGRCIHCHAGPELTTASVRNTKGGEHVIGAKAMKRGVALYDKGFFNIGITPTTDELGRGDLGVPPDSPAAFSRQALFARLADQLPGVSPIPFPIVGNDRIPARDEDLGLPVCRDKNGNGFCDPDEPIKRRFQRVAVDGAFKTPGLRNVELTGPYFHNGGMATLRQVVQFYSRGGNFCSFNFDDVDPAIAPIGFSEREEEQLVDFLISLTDRRVKYQQAPFDHPEIRLPQDGRDTDGTRVLPAVGAQGFPTALTTFLQLDPHDAVFTPRGQCHANYVAKEPSEHGQSPMRPGHYPRSKD